MASVVSINQKQILAFIDIPTFSDDVRGIILDYMHTKLISKVTLNGLPYFLLLGPYLVNNQLCLQIAAYDDTSYHMLSSFSFGCEPRAIKEYNTLKNDLVLNVFSFHTQCYATMKFLTSPRTWEKFIFGEMREHSYLGYFNLFVFNPDNQSTIRFRISEYQPNDFGMYNYRSDSDSECIEYTDFRWSGSTGPMRFRTFEDAYNQAKNCCKLVSIHGTRWHAYLSDWGIM
jgi:hypothetical protein